MTQTASPISASAPGSLMLMGEHAVLQGSHALCAAVTDRVAVRIERGEPGRYEVESALGSATGSLRNVQDEPELRFVLQAIRQTGVREGFRLTIDSHIDSTIGFGSSAAVTTATVAALRSWKGEVFDRSAIFRETLKGVRDVQGRGSGADVAASTYGGVVLYRADPLFIEPIRRHLPLAAVYCGYKTPTPVVIAHVDALRAGQPGLYAKLEATIDDTVLAGARALQEADLEQLGSLFRFHQGLQASMGTEDETLARLVHALSQQPGVLGSKISGSGLGDCVIALGNPSATVEGFDSREVIIDLDGVTLSLPSS